MWLMGKEELSYVVSYWTVTEVGAAGLAEGVVVEGVVDVVSAGAALAVNARSADTARTAKFFMLLWWLRLGLENGKSQRRIDSYIESERIDLSRTRVERSRYFKYKMRIECVSDLD